MRILVSNLGSTSFKYKLYDMSSTEVVVATGEADRIGQAQSSWALLVGAEKRSGESSFANHGEAISHHLKFLRELGALSDQTPLGAVGFKAVHGGPISGAVRVDEAVLKTMEDFSDVAPAHNPPYIAAMRSFAKLHPETPQVAAFETAFHQSVPEKRQVYAIPYEWTEQLGIRRYGFHGASHRYIATRLKEIFPEGKKIINCHLGGSSSLCAISDGKSVANSFGMTVQSGLPQAARVGDFDTFALIKLKAAGISESEIWRRLGKEGGLLGASGISQDMRDIDKAATAGDKRAQLAFDMFVEAIRFYLGAYLNILNGADAIVFTGGIGQFSTKVRQHVLANLDYAGILLDENKNQMAKGHEENRLDAAQSKVRIYALPTNEELIVARQVRDLLQKS